MGYIIYEVITRKQGTKPLSEGRDTTPTTPRFITN